jgi:hypothetical protein
MHKDIFLFRVSSRFWSEVRRNEDFVFVRLFHPVGIVPSVPIQNIHVVEQKKQPNNTKLQQEVAVTVTQANHEAVWQRGHKIVTLT